MTIKLSGQYIIQDSFPKPKYFDSANNPMTDSAIIKEMETDLFKGLLLVTTADENNSMSLNIAIETPKTGNFKQYYAFSKTMQAMMHPAKRYDSTSKIYNIDDILVHKFLTTTKDNDSKAYSGFYLAQVRSYFLFVKVDFMDEAVGEDFEKALLSSSFRSLGAK